MRLEESFNLVYSKFKLYFYREVMGKFKNREATLTTVETFCMELIYAMGNPTINEFASFANISSPNAAYKINKLIQKGYLVKQQSKNDRREYHLQVTQKYLDYYNISVEYVNRVVGRLQERLDETEQKTLQKILDMMANELMPEMALSQEKAEEKAWDREAAKD